MSCKIVTGLLITVWIDKVVLHEDNASAVSMCARMVYSVGHYVLWFIIHLWVPLCRSSARE